jgi:hypothetical protein
MPKTRAHDLYRGMLRPGDPEFAAKIRSNLAPEDRQAVDPSRAVLAPTNNMKAGMYVRPGMSQTTAELYGNMYTEGKPLQPDTVYGFGDDANQMIWSHEFRHRAGNVDEHTNRLKDAAMAGSEKQWNQAVQSYWEYLYMKVSDTITHQEAEKALVDGLGAAYPDMGNWRTWASKDKKTMLSPEAPKPLPKKPVRSKKR